MAVRLVLRAMPGWRDARVTVAGWFATDDGRAAHPRQDSRMWGPAHAQRTSCAATHITRRLEPRALAVVAAAVWRASAPRAPRAASCHAAARVLPGLPGWCGALLSGSSSSGTHTQAAALAGVTKSRAQGLIHCNSAALNVSPFTEPFATHSGCTCNRVNTRPHTSSSSKPTSN
jgi:hypothetical protein